MAAQSPSRTQKHDERRWGPRVEVDLAVRLELRDGRSAPARLRNASVSGALLECAEELPAFTTLRVEIPATDGLREPLQLGARVVRAEHPYLGVEWRDLAPDSLISMLEKN
jgi:PilZ domain